MEMFVIIILILLNAFFALSEIAFVSSNEHKLKDLALYDKKAKEVLKLRKEPDKFLSTIQVGMTLTGIISGTFSGVVLADNLNNILIHIPYIKNISYQVSLISLILLITYLSIVFGELIPKIFAFRNPEVIITKLISFIKIFSIIIFPLVIILSFSIKVFFKLIGRKPISNNEMNLIKQILGATKVALMENKIEKEQEKIIKNAIKINKIKIQEIMVKKKDIKYLKSDMILMDALIEAHIHQHTRYPIFDIKKNKTIGYVNFKDIINVLKFNPDNPSILSICRPIIYLNGQEYVIGALKKMSKNFQHIALIVNSKNEEIGLITLEDIVEIIIGDINDEYDFIPDYLYKIAYNRYIAGGKVKLTKLNEIVSESIPMNDISLNEWLEKQFNTNINVDSMIKLHDVTFIIKKLNRSKIYEVIIEFNKSNETTYSN